MNRKLYDMVMSIMSAVGATCVLVDLIIGPAMRLWGDSNELLRNVITDHIKFFLGLVLIGIVALYVFYFRRRHTNLYDLQYTMAKNNKLHPLRALAVITHDCEKHENNKLRIETATFLYRLTNNQTNPKCLDVEYRLTFGLKRRWLQRVTDAVRRFRLYAISEYDADLKGISLQVNKTGQMPKVLSRTSRGKGGDQMQRFSGLEEIETILPKNIDWKREITLEVKYLIENQIKEDDGQYSFAIIPKNYSNRIRNIDVELFSNGTAIKNLHCQRIGLNGVLETIATFPDADGTKVPYRASFKPDMKSVYFIQFDLPDNAKQGDAND